MAGLSTHVLDTSKGKPAAELKIELHKILDTEKILIKTVLTNEDGRIDGPLLSAESLEEIHSFTFLYCGIDEYIGFAVSGLNESELFFEFRYFSKAFLATASESKLSTSSESITIKGLLIAEVIPFR